MKFRMFYSVLAIFLIAAWPGISFAQSDGSFFEEQSDDGSLTIETLPTLTWQVEIFQYLNWGMTANEVNSNFGGGALQENWTDDDGFSYFSSDLAIKWLGGGIDLSRQPSDFTFIRGKLYSIDLISATGWEDKLLTGLFAQFGPALREQLLTRGRRSYEIVTEATGPRSEDFARCERSEEYYYYWYGRNTSIVVWDILEAGSHVCQRKVVIMIKNWNSPSLPADWEKSMRDDANEYVARVNACRTK